ncbi:hypothetical protein IBA8402_09240 [Pseudomonas syringae]
MTKVKENAAIQLSAATSTSFDQINAFAHQYDRGGNLTINGKPSYSVDQAADYILRDNAPGRIAMATAPSTSLTRS